MRMNMENSAPFRLPLEEYRYVFARVPRLCVDLVFENGDDILLTLRDIDPGRGFWHMPGGGVLRGETVQGALRRIALDETGLEPASPELLGVMEFSAPDSPFFHTVSLVYRVRQWSGTLRGSNQGKELRFFRELPEKMIREQGEFLRAEL
jgi:ADP-ribose pyrophosphatase YjhB (NUDIX family)